MEYIVLFQADEPFERSIIYAVTLGGDTDTIATMAGAIAGAYHGLEAIPKSWIDVCEGIDEAMDSGEELLKIVQIRTENS